MHRFQLGSRGGTGFNTDVYLPSIWRHVAYGHNYPLGKGLRFRRELPAYIIVDWGGSST